MLHQENDSVVADFCSHPGRKPGSTGGGEGVESKPNVFGVPERSGLPPYGQGLIKVNKTECEFKVAQKSGRLTVVLKPVKAGGAKTETPGIVAQQIVI